MLSSFFGAGAIADAFFVAFRIPNFFRRLLAEGAFAQAFVPVLSEFQEGSSREELVEFVRIVAGNFGTVLLVISVVGCLIAPALVTVFTLGSWEADERFQLTTSLLVIMFPYLGLISFTAFLGSILNTFDRFSVPAATPVLLNIALMIGALFCSQWFEEPVFALAWAVIVAGVIQLVCHIPPIVQLNLMRMPKINWSLPGVRRVLKLLGPAVSAASVGQINILVGTVLAAQLVVGSVSWLYFADRLIELPVGMIAIALQTVILPTLSRLSSRSSDVEFRNQLLWGIRVGIVIGIPASAALFTLAIPLTATIFFHGEFTAHDVNMVAVALQAFSIGVFPLMLVRILAAGFFARQNTQTPFQYAAVSVATNIVVSLCLFQWLGHVGIAIATTVAAFVHFGLLVMGLMRRHELGMSRALSRNLWQSLVSCILMVVALVLISPKPSYWIDAGIGSKVGMLSGLVFAGLVVYFGSCFALGMRPREYLESG